MAEILNLPFVDQIGCQYVLGTRKEYNQKTKKWDTVHVYCKKMRADANSALCPHHKVVLAADEHKPALLAAKRKLKAEKKALLEAELERSPLRAENPTNEERATGYER